MTPGTEGGGSQPHLFETDSGQFIVKTANNPQGPRVLVNELVAGLCLDWLGVTHPQGAVVDIPQDVIDDSPGAKFSNGSPLSSGLAFGSAYWHSDAQGTVGPECLANKGDIAGTLALDTWIRNNDGRQYRVRAISDHPGSYEMIPLDQGHCFGAPSWASDALEADRAVVVPAPVAPITRPDLEPFIAQLRSFNSNVASAIVAEAPDSWLTSEERNALSRYLAERAKLAASALETAYPGGAQT